MSNNPAPGTGTTFDPTVKEPTKISQGAADAGIQQPAGSSVKGVLVQQIPVEEAEKQLDELNVDEWVKLHYDKGDFNIQSMANVLRESTEDIYNRLHVMGYDLPDGTYSV